MAVGFGRAGVGELFSEGGDAAPTGLGDDSCCGCAFDPVSASEGLRPADLVHGLLPFSEWRFIFLGCRIWGFCAALIMIMRMANLTLVYGLRLLPEGEVTKIEDATLKLANGHEAHVTMHTIEGSREEIEAQLKQSLDAFFDFYPEI
jgi:hypothetical protein